MKDMKHLIKIDLHMHTDFSDGTDSPEIIKDIVKDKGITLFSVTDHDTTKAAVLIPPLLMEGDPGFLTGIEFSCRDEEGKYHILGYGYDPLSPYIEKVVALGHGYRMDKLSRRLEFLKSEYGFVFSDEDTEALFALSNPGKPHIGNLMVKYGYAENRQQAINEYINNCRGDNSYVRPEQAIECILRSGGIPILAHPAYGSGDQLIIGDEMEKRLLRLMDFGLKGLEGFYSGFTAKLRDEMLFFAEKYSLYITAGSDYHGKNKIVRLGDTGLDEVSQLPPGLESFLEDIGDRTISV